MRSSVHGCGSVPYTILVYNMVRKDVWYSERDGLKWPESGIQK